MAVLVPSLACQMDCLALVIDRAITLGQMRSSDGPRRLIVYCADYRCAHAHAVVVDADRWGDTFACRPKFTYNACGRRGVDVRPLFELARMEPVPKNRLILSFVARSLRPRHRCDLTGQMTGGACVTKVPASMLLPR